MRSRAAIANHPLHPAVVAIPIGAFTLALIADLVVLAGHPGAWAATARYALALGLLTSLLAAALGFIDYFTLKMTAAAARTATRHMILNLAAVSLFALSLWLRHRSPAGWSLSGFVLSLVAFLLLATSGWPGGELVFKHRIGVVD